MFHGCRSVRNRSVDGWRPVDRQIWPASPGRAIVVAHHPVMIAPGYSLSAMGEPVTPVGMEGALARWRADDARSRALPAQRQEPCRARQGRSSERRHACVPCPREGRRPANLAPSSGPAGRRPGGFSVTAEARRPRGACLRVQASVRGLPTAVPQANCRRAGTRQSAHSDELRGVFQRDVVLKTRGMRA